jgi:hypothetical protein
MTRLLTLALLLALATSLLASDRSGRWPAVRADYLREHRTCEACGVKAAVVHHVFPFHEYPERELDRANLIALCRGCHLTVGHDGNWREWNPCVREHAAYRLWESKSKAGEKNGSQEDKR